MGQSNSHRKMSLPGSLRRAKSTGDLRKPQSLFSSMRNLTTTKQKKIDKIDSIDNTKTTRSDTFSVGKTKEREQTKNVPTIIRVRNDDLGREKNQQKSNSSGVTKNTQDSSKASLEKQQQQQHREQNQNQAGELRHFSEPTAIGDIDCKALLALRNIETSVRELEIRINEMTYEELCVYHATFKDDLHNNWIKAYEVKEINLNVKPKKIENIEYIKFVMAGLNKKIFKGKP